MMFVLGTLLIIWPDKGIAGYMNATFGVPMGFYGSITIICALELLYRPGVLRFAVFSTPVMIYAGMSVPYFLHGLMTGSTSTGTTVVVAWVFVYWLMSWVNVRRGQLLQDQRYTVIK